MVGMTGHPPEVSCSKAGPRLLAASPQIASLVMAVTMWHPVPSYRLGALLELPWSRYEALRMSRFLLPGLAAYRVWPPPPLQRSGRLTGAHSRTPALTLRPPGILSAGSTKAQCYRLAPRDRHHHRIRGQRSATTPACGADSLGQGLDPTIRCQEEREARVTRAALLDVTGLGRP